MKKAFLKTLISVSLVLTLTAGGCNMLHNPANSNNNQGNVTNDGNNTGNSNNEVTQSTDWGIDQFNIGGNGSNDGQDTDVATGEFEFIPLVTDWTYDGDWQDNYSVSYSTSFINTDNLGKYSALKSAMEKVDEDINGAALDSYRDYNDFVKENLEYMNEDDFLSCYYYSNLTNYRSDTVMVSLMETVESYAGGAHPNTYYVSHNVDSKSGKTLEIQDVIADKEGFYNAVIDSLNKQFSQDGIGTDDLWENYEELIHSSITDPEYGCNFVMDYDSILMIYSPYELAAYAFGPVFIRVRYQECPEVFNKTYTAYGKENIIYNNYDGMNLYMDYDNDGTEENIMVNMLYNDEYGEYDNLVIETDTAKFQDENIYGFSYDVAGAKVDGRYFVILKTSVENDYTCTYIFSVENGVIKQTDEVFGSFESFTNPDCFFASQRLDLLSTYDGFKLSKINSDGKVEFMDDCYTATSHIQLTALRDINGYAVDSVGAPYGESKVIPKGSTVLIAGTDDDTYVDLRLEDGSYVRVYVDNDDWPQNIDGVDIQELFDGILFAG